MKFVSHFLVSKNLGFLYTFIWTISKIWKMWFFFTVCKNYDGDKTFFVLKDRAFWK